MLQQLRAFAGQQQPASDPVEQLERQLALEIGDAARQRRLGDMQLLGRLGDAAEVDHGDESAHFAKIHGLGSLCRSRIHLPNNNELDA